MTAQLAQTPVFKAFDNNGLPLFLGQLFTYAAGTTTPQATYVDSTQTTQNTNPVILNARGEANVWLNPTLSYKFVLQDSFGNQIWAVDNIQGALSLSGNIIPSADNQFSLGNASFRFANGYFGTQLYVGSSNTPVLNGGIVGYWPQTAAEIAAGVTPVNFAYVPGDIRRYGAKFDGATDDSAALLNWLKLGGKVPLTAPAGTSVHGTTLVIPNGSTIRGAGRAATIFKYTGASDQWQSNNPINMSTAANITISDLALQATAATAGKANYADVGSAFLYFTRVAFLQGMIGLILDQTEISSFVECDFELPNNAAAIGCWLVNGSEHTAGAAEGFTNQITFSECQFNGYAGTGIGVADDGVAGHCFLSCDFNSLAKHIRCAQVDNLTLIGGEYEACSVASITFESTKVGGAASPGNSSCCLIKGVTFAVGAAQVWQCNALGVLRDMEITECVISCTGTAYGTPNNVARIHAEGNNQINTGDSYAVINNYYDDLAFSCALTGSGSNPVIGNGTITAYTSRQGRQVTVRVQVTIGSTTTLGGGDWQLSLPTAAAFNNQEYWGSGAYYHAGTTAPVLARVTSGGAIAYGWQCSSNSPLTNANPAWAAGDIWNANITYMAASKIN